MSPLATSVTIRPASDADAAALHRLAVLDSASVPAGPVLVAEVDGELRAAISLWDGRAIADPFHPSVSLLALMRAHIARAHGRRRGVGARLTAALSATRRAPVPARRRYAA